MPKYVDHDARRREIIGRVWRLIAAEGIDVATTRRIAEETGFSNGLLSYYFPSKDSVMTAAFEHVFRATNRRAGAAADPPGVEGIRVLALEILPLDEERIAEARVVITFWQRALNNAAEADLFARAHDRVACDLRGATDLRDHARGVAGRSRRARGRG